MWEYFPRPGHPKAQNPEKEGPRMPEPSKMDMEAKQYFNSLPPALQEQLMQSAADLNTKEDLMRYCTNSAGRARS